MKADNKHHYKFINSQTGNAIYYYAVDDKLKDDDAKTELERVKAQVAIQNNLFLGIVYWQEIKEPVS